MSLQIGINQLEFPQVCLEQGHEGYLKSCSNACTIDDSRQVLEFLKSRRNSLKNLLFAGNVYRTRPENLLLLCQSPSRGLSIEYLGRSVIQSRKDWRTETLAPKATSFVTTAWPKPLALTK